MEEVNSKFFNEKYYKYVLPNGLQLIIYPNSHYKKTYASLSVNYGSIDQEFNIKTNSTHHKTPAGTAHFLEHMMTKTSSDKDIDYMFSSLGATFNAYTTFKETTFYFTTFSNFYECLNLLLDMIENPYFKEEAVTSERKVIEQELLMYQDDPFEVAMNTALEGIFSKNYVRDDVGGTIDTIADINVDILKLCYDTFYRFDNMVLTISGSLNLNRLVNFLHRRFCKSKRSNLEVEKINYYNDTITSQEIIKTMQTDHRYVFYIVKLNYHELKNIEIVSNSFYIEILFNYYFNNSSSICQSLIKNKVINYSFDYNFYLENEFAYMVFFSEPDNQELFIENIKRIINEFKTVDVPLEKFNHYKKLLYAEYILKFNKLENLTNTITEYYKEGLDYFNISETIDSISYDGFKKFQINLKYHGDCIVVVKGKDK